MVGPISDADRKRTMLKLKVGFVSLVGVSGGLITTQGDASLSVVAGAVAAGVVLGVVLVWFLFPDAETLSPGTNDKRRRFE